MTLFVTKMIFVSTTTGYFMRKFDFSVFKSAEISDFFRVGKNWKLFFGKLSFVGLWVQCRCNKPFFWKLFKSFEYFSYFLAFSHDMCTQRNVHLNFVEGSATIGLNALYFKPKVTGPSPFRDFRPISSKFKSKYRCEHKSCENAKYMKSILKIQNF